MDRWSVSVVATGKGGFRKSQKDRSLIMNNYLGIGVDGQVALDFHKVGDRRGGWGGGWVRVCKFHVRLVACVERGVVYLGTKEETVTATTTTARLETGTAAYDPARTATRSLLVVPTVVYEYPGI